MIKVSISYALFLQIKAGVIAIISGSFRGDYDIDNLSVEKVVRLFEKGD